MEETLNKIDKKLLIGITSAVSLLAGLGLSKIIFKNQKKSKDEEIKELVRTSYARIAKQSTEYNKASCCGIGTSCCGS